VFAVADAAPGGPAVAMLDDVVDLLRPGALADRMELVPAYYPRRTSLAGRVAMTASRLAAEASMATFVAEQLTSLRASPLGRWLGIGPAAEPPSDQPGPGDATAGRRAVHARPCRARAAR
jgi:hypothetical protein